MFSAFKVFLLKNVVIFFTSLKNKIQTNKGLKKCTIAVIELKNRMEL